MDEHVWVILWKTTKGSWQIGGVAYTPQERDELLRWVTIDGLGFQYAVVEGPLTNPREMAEAEARLGKF
jgi:hypothetical protein